MSGAYSRTHIQSANQHVQKAKGSRLMSHSILILFTRAAPRTKSMGLLIDVHFHPYTFYTCIAAYKNARGSRLMSRSILIAFTYTTTRTKSKRLPIDVSFHPYTFYTHSVAGSRSTVIILFIHSHHRRMKKQGTSLYLLYNTSQVSRKIVSIQFYNLTKVYCRM
jgi:hypothetical protein